MFVRRFGRDRTLLCLAASFVFLSAGCDDKREEIHTYSKSLRKYVNFKTLERLPLSGLEGTYQAKYSNRPYGVYRLAEARFWRGGRMNLTGGFSFTITGFFKSLITEEKRLFVEVKNGLRYQLFEILINQSRISLIPIQFDKDKLLKDQRDFSQFKTEKALYLSLNNRSLDSDGFFNLLAPVEQNSLHKPLSLLPADESTRLKLDAFRSQHHDIPIHPDVCASKLADVRERKGLRQEASLYMLESVTVAK